MTFPIIDSHIHLDWYDQEKREQILRDMDTYHVKGLLSVSSGFDSCRSNLQLSNEYKEVSMAAGFHPEQKLPAEGEIDQILSFIDQHHTRIAAIGEVGLPYYLRQEDSSLPLDAYKEILEAFIRKAVQYHKPVVLHAIYDDADVTCDLLEKYSVRKAHFHWFKGSTETLKRMVDKRYYISVTPDCLYKERTQQLIKRYPLELLMVETDGPWEFTSREWTHPKMIHQSINKICEIKQKGKKQVYNQLYDNTIRFYELSK
ncbi:TatD family hydrolase [Halobacillus sp. A5]|uniref:TatD family hydrolase n=1 Tax=Halobacillus sp. A5 TaxID=2880263 RepID=UPI0020A6B544|nr:TatD family hydrolase [Halobacillus sp. A5]MCP3029153.1 TatD family hydrolase [Halobacillus sp. A5]